VISYYVQDKIKQIHFPLLIFAISCAGVIAAVSRQKIYLGKEGDKKAAPASRLIIVKEILLPGKRTSDLCVLLSFGISQCLLKNKQTNKQKTSPEEYQNKCSNVDCSLLFIFPKQ